MRVCIHRSTGRLREAQSSATPGTLLANVAAAGEDPAQYEERDVSQAEFDALLAAAAPPPPTAADWEATCEREINGQRILRLLFDLNYDQESRLRVQEGRPTITRAQYWAALKSAYAALS